MRLDDFLATRFGLLSRTRLRNAILSGECKVDGRMATPGERLQADRTIELSLRTRVPTSMHPEPIELEVVHEDESLAVVVKPSGMLVHPTMSVKTGTLANGLSHRWNPFLAGVAASSVTPAVTRPTFPHRLDRDTSGLMVVARTPQAGRYLSAAFAHRRVRKCYLAVAGGFVQNDSGVIDAPIGRVEDTSPQWQVSEAGSEALTRYEVIGRRDGKSLLRLEPVTGRTNQLRIHCEHIGHPILGDRVYGGSAASRLCLHAHHLEFPHPSGGVQTAESSLPAEITAIWAK